MTSSMVHSSPRQNLHDAICLLALIIERPHNLDEQLSSHERNSDQNDQILPTVSTSIQTDAPPTALDVDTDCEDPTEDAEAMDVDGGIDKQSYLAMLRDKVLDRLAETLARFKSDPERKTGSRLGASHVSSTMMIVDEQLMRIKFKCAKNEGLDQSDTTEDTDFLNSWRQCMEDISRAGKVKDYA
jgi:hypothetical protein